MQALALPVIAPGVAGALSGADLPVPALLMHPLTVVVTLYVAFVVTVIEEVVALVLHSNEPVEAVLNTEFPQLFSTVIAGADGTAIGAAMPVPAALLHPFTVLVTL